MALTISFTMIVFIVIMQASIPFLLKKTLAFGVTIPESHTDDKTISTYKKTFSILIFILGILSLLGYVIWVNQSTHAEERIILVGLGILFGILLISMVLYLYFHAKTTRLKSSQNWGAELKQVRIADLAIRSKDEMLPTALFALPMIITVGLIAYTASQYANMPDLIPTHWGPSGQPDAFSEKTPFSVIALLLILLIMQGMMLGINALTKKSGIKLNAAKSKTSQIQQLTFRKYTSWFLFMTSFLITILFGFLQLVTIHEGLGNAIVMLALPLGFLFMILIATGVYAFKVGQSGSKIHVLMEDEAIPGVTDVDDDQYWKAGVFYVNKNDPSIFVEKRFGVGWTINFGQPIGYLVLFGPILLIIVISLLL